MKNDVPVFTAIWEIELAVNYEEQKDKVTQKQLADQSKISLSSYKNHLLAGRKRILNYKNYTKDFVSIEEDAKVFEWFMKYSENHLDAIRKIIVNNS